MNPRPRFTIEQYEKLKNAIANYAITGVKSVQYGDKTVTYLSYEEMKDVLDDMKKELFPTDITRLAVFDRGYFPTKR